MYLLLNNQALLFASKQGNIRRYFLVCRFSCEATGFRGARLVLKYVRMPLPPRG